LLPPTHKIWWSSAMFFVPVHLAALAFCMSLPVRVVLAILGSSAFQPSIGCWSNSDEVLRGRAQCEFVHHCFPYAHLGLSWRHKSMKATVVCDGHESYVTGANLFQC
ncbi:uncharacterized protein LACBIDRAFT_399315, partial [Laccaria bicolor S238N-H82]